MKTNWKKLNEGRVREGMFASEDGDGFNGMFLFRINSLFVVCVASDGRGWQHVSVTLGESTFTPSWSIMCVIKELFWGDDEWVIQFHPPAGMNVNNHPGCLHLWRPTQEKLPLPDPLMVGIPGREIKSPEDALGAYQEALRLAEEKQRIQ